MDPALKSVLLKASRGTPNSPAELSAVEIASRPGSRARNEHEPWRKHGHAGRDPHERAYNHRSERQPLRRANSARGRLLARLAGGTRSARTARPGTTGRDRLPSRARHHPALAEHPGPGRERLPWRLQPLGEDHLRLLGQRHIGLGKGTVRGRYCSRRSSSRSSRSPAPLFSTSARTASSASSLHHSDDGRSSYSTSKPPTLILKRLILTSHPQNCGR